GPPRARGQRVPSHLSRYSRNISSSTTLRSTPRRSASARTHAASSADEGCQPRSGVLCWLGIGLGCHFRRDLRAHLLFGPRLGLVSELLADVLVVERGDGAVAVRPPSGPVAAAIRRLLLKCAELLAQVPHEVGAADAVTRWDTELDVDDVFLHLRL